MFYGDGVGLVLVLHQKSIADKVFVESCVVKLDSINAVTKKFGLRCLNTCSVDNLMARFFIVEKNTPEPMGVLAFRGTAHFKNWITNLNTATTNWSDTALVHQGFLKGFEKLWPLCETAVKDTPPNLYYVGHSLGAAFATLAAATRPPKALYTLGSPRVGNQDFCQLITSTVPSYRIVQHCDIVPTLPWENPLSPFTHLGQYHYFNHLGEHLVDPQNADVFADQFKRNLDWSEILNPHALGKPIKALSDHSPINYTYALEQELGSQVFQ